MTEISGQGRFKRMSYFKMTIKFIGKVVAASAVLLFLYINETSGQTYNEYMALGDSLYAIYDYPGSVREYEAACEADSRKFEVFHKLARSLNLEGELAPSDSQLAIFERARDAAMRALELGEGNADAHFQLARALGKIALYKGVFKSVSLAKQVREQCLRALELDSLHDGAWHILARWNREVGKKPKIFRVPLGLGAANKDDAINYMKKAIEINPNNLHHHLEMGNTYRRFKMNDLAIEEYRKCLNLPYEGPLDEKYRSEAKKYLAEMD